MTDSNQHRSRSEGDDVHLPDSSSESAMRRALPIYYALLLAILTAGALYLASVLRHELLIIFISLLFAAAVARPASYLERWRVPRGLAALAVYIAAFGLIALISWLVLPPLFNQLANLIGEIPDYVDRYKGLEQTYDRLRQEYPGLEPFQSEVTAFGGRILAGVGERLAQLPTDVFGLFLDLLSVFIISLLLVSARSQLLAFGLSLVHPRHREQTERVIAKMWLRIGQYLRAKLIVMAIIAGITYVALLLIGVPFALLLAIVVGLGEAVPRIGPWLARIPLLVIAAFEGWTTFGLTFAASIVIENAKGYVISPWVEGDQLDIHPLLVIIAVLLGAGLLGAAGAFIAVPAAAMLQVLMEEVVIPWRRQQIGVEEPSSAPAHHEVAAEDERR